MMLCAASVNEQQVERRLGEETAEAEVEVEVSRLLQIVDF
jgi:hypothetical protein